MAQTQLKATERRVRISNITPTVGFEVLTQVVINSAISWDINAM
jgi:hypothetical protein